MFQNPIKFKSHATVSDEGCDTRDFRVAFPTGNEG